MENAELEDGEYNADLVQHWKNKYERSCTELDDMKTYNAEQVKLVSELKKQNEEQVKRVADLMLSLRETETQFEHDQRETNKRIKSLEERVRSADHRAEHYGTQCEYSEQKMAREIKQLKDNVFRSGTDIRRVQRESDRFLNLFRDSDKLVKDLQGQINHLKSTSKYEYRDDRSQNKYNPIVHTVKSSSRNTNSHNKVEYEVPITTVNQELDAKSPSSTIIIDEDDTFENDNIIHDRGYDP